MDINQFLQQMKAKAEHKAKQMAALELSVWNSDHESQLKQNFGFTDKTLAIRKKELQKTARS